MKPSSNQATSISIAQQKKLAELVDFAKAWAGAPVVGGCIAFNIENIPSEIRDINQWVRWKLVTKSDDKPTKIPYDTNGGEHAKVNDPSTWGSLNTGHGGRGTGCNLPHVG